MAQKWALVVWAALVVVACGSDEPTAPTSDACPRRFGGDADGACLGPSTADLCATGEATAGCGAVVDVGAASELEAAAAGASAGDCLRLAAGSYGDVTLPGGVGLVGCGLASSSLGRITLEQGAGAVVRGLVARGIVVDGATEALVDHVRLQEGDRGLDVRAGSSVTVRRSDVVGMTGDAIRAVDAASLVVEDSVLELTDGSGLWAQCGTGCDCPTKSDVTLERVEAISNAGYGAALLGVDASLRDVVVKDTAVGTATEGGGGIVGASCATVTADGVTVEGTARVGVMLHGASGVLGGQKGIIVVDGKIGIWLHDAGDAELRHFTVQQSEGVGLGVSGDAQGIIVVDGLVSDTAPATLPGIDEGGVAVGSVQVSDGILWRDGGELSLSAVEVADSAIHPLRIIGPVPSGSLADISFTGSDAGKAIAQQDVSAGDPAPALMGDVPSLEATSDLEGYARPPQTPEL